MNIFLILAAVWAIGTAVMLYSIFKSPNPRDPSGGLLMVLFGPIMILVALFWPIALPFFAYLNWRDKRKKRDKR